MFAKIRILACFVSALTLVFVLAGCNQKSGNAAIPLDSAPSSTNLPPTTKAVITGLTPSEAKINDVITIAGSGFGNNSGAGSLTIGGATASIISWNDTEITAAVPASALTGTVTATVNGEESEGSHFVVLWDKENPDNVLIPGNHVSPLNEQLIPDGSNGTIIVWNDYRNYSPPPPPGPGVPPPLPPPQINIYAQRLNSRGIAKWKAEGVAVSTSVGGQFFPQLVSDDDGGAIIVWEDYRSDGINADIFAQRISRNGVVLWSSDVAVTTAPDSQERPRITPDGTGGAIIVWQDHRSGARYDVYAQRLDGNGVPQWTNDGVAISRAANNPQFLFPQIIPDGSGGAVIVWQDMRNGSWFMYAQRIDSAGIVQWTPNGAAVSTTGASYHYVACPVPDGTGGAIIAWESSSGANGIDVYAQKLNGSGALQWGAPGVVLSAAPADQRYLQMAPAGSGGAIVVWEDERVGSAFRDIYAQRVDSSGNAIWTADGVPVCTADYSQYEPQIVNDGMGGAIIAWYDYRNYNNLNNGIIQGVDIFVQRINASGNAVWTENGKAVSTADLHQMYPKIVADRSGGAIVVWEDERSGTSVDIYAQGISTSGHQ